MIPISKPTIVRKDLEYVLNCLITEKLEEGNLAKEFEKAVSDYLGTKYVAAVNNFTSALHLALLSLKVTEGDEIIIPAYSDLPIINAINYVKAKPVLVDVDIDTYSIQKEKVLEKITDKTKAIIITHNFGIPADITNFSDFKIPIIEDCSYAFGAEIAPDIHNEEIKKKVGNFGLISIFSFDTDCIITTGNGAILCSNSRDLINEIKDYKFNNNKKLDEYKIKFDYRFPDICAALGLSQLKIVDKLIGRRREIADFYNNKFMKSKYKIHKEISGKKNVYSKYVLLIEGSLDKLIEYSKKHKIHLKRPIENPAYIILKKDPKEFPNSEYLYRKLVQIPLYPTLKNKEIEFITNTLLKVL